MENKTDLKAYAAKNILRGMNILAVNLHRSRSGREQTVEMLDEGALAASGVTDKTDKLTALYLQVNIIYCSFFEWSPAAVSVSQRAHLDYRHLLIVLF